MTHDQTISNMTHTINTLAEKLAAVERENAELLSKLAAIIAVCKSVNRSSGKLAAIENILNPKVSQ